MAFSDLQALRVPERRAKEQPPIQHGPIGVHLTTARVRDALKIGRAINVSVREPNGGLIVLPNPVRCGHYTGRRSFAECVQNDPKRRFLAQGCRTAN
jgi:hypothetical protein